VSCESWRQAWVQWMTAFRGLDLEQAFCAARFWMTIETWAADHLPGLSKNLRPGLSRAVRSQLQHWHNANVAPQCKASQRGCDVPQSSVSAVRDVTKPAYCQFHSHHACTALCRQLRTCVSSTQCSCQMCWSHSTQSMMGSLRAKKMLVRAFQQQSFVGLFCLMHCMHVQLCSWRTRVLAHVLSRVRQSLATPEMLAAGTQRNLSQSKCSRRRCEHVSCVGTLCTCCCRSQASCACRG
jgi:hypothetical protein